MKAKIAGKSSQDPKQQELRDHKKDFNKEVSLLIAQIIAFKKGINGRGEPRVGLPPSNIKDPLPIEINQYLSQLSNRFVKIVDESKDIINEQKEYSKTRRKGRKELLAQFITQDPLIKEASWWGSRLWAYVKYSPRFWNKNVKLRMKMLWVSSDVSNGLLDLEDFLVSSDENAIPRGFHNFVQMRNRISKDMGETLVDLLELSKEAAGNPPEITNEQAEQEHTKAIENDLPRPLSGSEENELKEEELEEPENWEPNIDWLKIDAIQKDLPKAKLVILLLLSKNLLPKSEADDLSEKVKNLVTFVQREIGLNRVSKKYLENPVAAKQFSNIVSNFNNEYDKLISSLNEIVKNKTGDDNNSFEKMVSSIKKLAFGTNEAINKLASNWLTRTLNRWKLNIFPSYTDKIRLACVKMVMELHEKNGDLQDLLEKQSTEVSKISESMIDLLVSFEALANKMLLLAENHNSEYEEARLNDKKVKFRPIPASSISSMKKSQLIFRNASMKIKGQLEELQGLMGVKTEKAADE